MPPHSYRSITMMYGDSHFPFSLCQGLLLVALAVLTATIPSVYRYLRIW